MNTVEHEHSPDPHHDTYSKTVFGFWIYLMTDFILFATLFATYTVLRKSTFGGPSASDLFHLPFNLIETLILTTCSLTSGMAGAFAHRKNQYGTILFLCITFFLGLIFVGMQLMEFSQLIGSGNGWNQSAFLSAYFTIVGTHTMHMVIALSWVIIFLIPLFREGITPSSLRRVTCLRMFWQFLTIVWIFIFTIIYLLGEV